MQVRTLILSAGLLAGLTAVNLPAAQLSGVFYIAGNLTVTQDTIAWANTNSPFTPEQANIGSNATGSFAPLDGTTVTIDDLNSTTEPVGQDYGPDFFISFDAAPTDPMLESDYFFPGVFATASCLDNPPAINQLCTPGPPLTPGGSPFSFVNVNGDVANPIETSVTWQIEGVTTDGGTWIGNFAATFDAPFQTVLSDIAANSGTGSVSDTFNATITVTPGTTTPEPDSAYMLASGLVLILLSIGSRRFVRRQHQ